MEGYFTHGKTAILAFNIKIDTLLFKYNSYFNNEIELSTSKLADQPDVLAMCYIYSDKQKIKALPSTEKFYFEGIWSEKNINFSSEISQINSPSYASLYGDLTFLKDKLQLILKPSGFEVNGSHWQFAENNKITIANRNIIVKLEKSLGFYIKDIYLKNESILPEKYQHIYNVKIPSHFKSLYFLLIIICAFLLFVTIYNPAPDTNVNTLSQTTIEALSKK